MYTHIKRIVQWTALVGIIVPPTALAAMMLQLPADAIAGLGFDVLINGARGNDTVAVQMTTPDGTTQALRGKADANGSATLTVNGNLAEHAGTYAFTADGTSADLDVVPDAIDPVLSTIDVWTPRIDANGDDAASVTVTLRDQYGNPLPGRIVTLVSGRGDDDVSAETNQTDENGEQHFSVRSYDDGTITLRAIDLLSGIPLVDSATIRSGDVAMGGNSNDAPASRVSNGNRFYYAQVAGFDVIDGFEIDAPETLPLGEEASKITIRAVDKDGNTVEDYVGTVLFSSTDPDATLPNFGKYTFKERDLGKKDFPLVLKFKQSGDQTFRVEDQNDRTIFGDVTVTVGGGSVSGGAIVITKPLDGGTVNGTSVVIEGTGPKFTNIVVLGGATDTPGSTDATGHFAIPVALRSDQQDYTIRVQDEDKRYDSGPILLHLDATPPAIGTITFTPEVPQEGQKVLVVVKSESGLTSVVLTITHKQTNAVQEITLNPAQTAGTYQAFFTAPTPDDYQPKLVATDKAGNVAELRTTLSIGSPAPEVVDNVTAEARVNAVNIGWTETSDDVDGYRVYVGETPGIFNYSLDTKQRTDRAIVAGLTPGTPYYFAVTALKGDRESPKSTVVSATAIGMTITVTPADQGLYLQWSTVDTDAPLSHFLLEYGIDDAHLTEQRLLNRDLTEFSLTDLLNGVDYAVRLTPVTTTGKKLTDLAASSHGAPSGTGFHPGAGDPIPDGMHTEELPHIAPEIPASGIPAVFGWIAAAAGIVGGWHWLQRRAERRRTSAFLASLPQIR